MTIHSNMYKYMYVYICTTICMISEWGKEVASREETG